MFIATSTFIDLSFVFEAIEVKEQCTLESGIDVGQGINVGPGIFA